MQILLVHRSERAGDPWSGQMGLPGGRVKLTDSSPRAALHREVDEEVGIRLNEQGTELGTLSIGHPMRRLEMRVQPWVYALANRPEVKIGSEIADTFWVPLSELPSRNGMNEVTVRNDRWRVDSFNVDGRIVWGFTYRVLSELLQLLNILS